MTEAEWHWALPPEEIVERLPSSPRRRRLLCVACCRRVITLTRQPSVREALDIAERYADGWERRASMISAAQQILPGGDAHRWGTHPFADACIDNAVAAICELGTGFHQRSVFSWLALIYPHERRPNEAEEMAEAHRTLLSDIFGNPFRPVAFAPEWRTDTAVTLARQMYESREFGAMPILADALQDAGCDNDDILDHCRDTSQVHVRGCWVCDLVLGKQ